MAGKYKILLIDNLIVRKMDLEVGENIIENNIVDTKIENKPQFNKAAKINLSPDFKITITPCDGVLCYIKIYGTVRWRLVEPNQTLILNARDTCLLFPNRIWFKIISAMDITNGIKSPKRKFENIIEDELPIKRCCSEVSIEIEPSNYILQNNNNASNLMVTKCAHEVDTVDDNDSIYSNLVHCPNSNILETKNEDELCSIEKCNEQINFALNVDHNVDNHETSTNSNTNDLNQTSTSNVQKNIPKQKCKYGNECYRMNDEHKKKYSHPGDIDYDLPDNRPECVYGKKCYRKNPQHKLEYKHTVSKRKRTQRSLEPISLEDLSDWEESEEESVDESEYEPSFIDDESLEELESDFEEDV